MSAITTSEPRLAVKLAQKAATLAVHAAASKATTTAITTTTSAEEDDFLVDSAGTLVGMAVAHRLKDKTDAYAEYAVFWFDLKRQNKKAKQKQTDPKQTIV